MSDIGFASLHNGDDAAPTSRQQIAEAIRRLRQAAERLPTQRTPDEDLKILSQTLRELRRAFTVFAPYRTQRKVTVFGSARTLRDAPAYKTAESLGKAMAENGWFVVTGAATGIMEAGHRGAGRGRSMGINIMLPFEQAANEIIHGDEKLVTMKYFFTRKLMFVKECDAVVCLPGGFGTLDEAFEVLTLLQTGKRELMPLVFLDAPGGSYWKDWLSYIRKHLLDGKMVSHEDLSLFRVTESVDETVDEILRFYRVFDDMEYINNRLVLRLLSPVADAKLTNIQRDFADILTDGDFRQELLELPANGTSTAAGARARLVFNFNRRSLGRLRELIDTINYGSAS
ncbi:MAG TPA: TIGR00730 family Rossman fold protein [Lacipirellulaceae bacterium]|nr:TIGR00730 family Rossman fold protein [Lacipirellulaceae bacterium]